MSWDIFGKLLMGQTWLPWQASGEQHSFKTLWRKRMLELNIKAAWDFNIPLPLRKWKHHLWRSVSQNTWPSEKGHLCVVHNFWQRLCQGTAAQTVNLNRVPQSCSWLHWPGVNLSSKHRCLRHISTLTLGSKCQLRAFTHQSQSSSKNG